MNTNLLERTVEGFLLVTYTLITTYVIATNIQNKLPKIHHLVLQKSSTFDKQNWINLKTNNTILTLDQYWFAFTARMSERSEFYRVIEIH